MVNKEMLEKFKKIIDKSNKIVFFGGAGVSTESGIPDFRSKDGLYNQHDVRFEQFEPEYLLSRKCLEENPEVFFEFYRQKMDTRSFEPNVTHKALAKLEESGKMSAVVTQNIDGLHQKAGSKNVYEIHGTTSVNVCDLCKLEYAGDYIFNSDGIPRCRTCGDIVRPAVTLYGEQLPTKAVNSAMSAIHAADCLIIGGTSLNVYPAANFISYFVGDHIVVINKEHLDITLGKDDLVFECGLGEVFSELEKFL